MLRIGGELIGKPGCADAALRRWQAMMGGTGELLTGHAVARLADGAVTATTSGTETTLIRFSTPSAAEITAYVGTGEPLQPDRPPRLGTGRQRPEVIWVPLKRPGGSGVMVRVARHVGRSRHR